MGLRVGKWRIKKRVQPISAGGVAFLLHITSTEWVLLLAVAVTLLFQLRRKAIRVVEEFWQNENCLDCTRIGTDWAWVLFFVALGLLSVITLWKIRSARQFVLQFLIPLTVMIAAGLLAMGFYFHDQLFWFFAVLFFARVCLAFYCYFEIETEPEGASRASVVAPVLSLPLKYERSMGLASHGDGHHPK